MTTHVQFDIYQSMGLGQQSLFDIYNYVEKPVDDGKTGIARGKYNKRKLIVKDPWEAMNQCYRELGNYCPLPIFSNENSMLKNNGLRLWHTVYTNETYSYFGEDFEGEDFKVVEAEIIGTELLPIEWRLFLHLNLLELLKEGYSLSESISRVLELMEWYKAGFLLKDLFIYLWTMDCEV